MRLKSQEEADLLFYKASMLEKENKRLRTALIAFREAKASVGGNSYDGVDEHTRYLLDHADAQAGLALSSVSAPGQADG